MPRGRPPKRVAMARQQLASYSRGMVEAPGSNSSTMAYNFPCTSTSGILQDILKCTQCLETARKPPVFNVKEDISFAQTVILEYKYALFAIKH